MRNEEIALVYENLNIVIPSECDVDKSGSRYNVTWKLIPDAPAFPHPQESAFVGMAPALTHPGETSVSWDQHSPSTGNTKIMRLPLLLSSRISL